MQSSVSVSGKLWKLTIFNSYVSYQRASNLSKYLSKSASLSGPAYFPGALECHVEDFAGTPQAIGKLPSGKLT